MWTFKKEKYTGPTTEDWLNLYEIKFELSEIAANAKIKQQKRERQSKIGRKRKYYSGFETNFSR